MAERGRVHPMGDADEEDITMQLETIRISIARVTQTAPRAHILRPRPGEWSATVPVPGPA